MNSDARDTRPPASWGNRAPSPDIQFRPSSAVRARPPTDRGARSRMAHGTADPDLHEPPAPEHRDRDRPLRIVPRPDPEAALSEGVGSGRIRDLAIGVKGARDARMGE